MELGKKIRFNPEEILGPEGPIAQYFPTYEPRSAQIQMSQAVLKNMIEKKHILLEAGTGVGKSYAFLIPAIELALSGEGPIVISTNTISLQEQIFNKDIPDLKKYLNLPDLKVVLRKGRGNYLSKRRLKNAQNYEWKPDQIPEIEDIESWSESSKLGTIQDLNFIPSNEMWEQVQSDQGDCLGKKCPTYSSCFYFKSKTEAEQANLIICNHSLSALDLILKHKTDGNVTILPNFKHLIIDEAHALEEAIRKAETFEWRQGSAATLVKRATNRKGNGLLDLVSKLSDASPEMVDRAGEAIDKLKHFTQVNEEFFEKDVIPFVKDNKKFKEKLSSKRIHPGNLVSPRSDSLLATISSANQYISSIVAALKRDAEEELASKDVKNLYELLSIYHGRTKEVACELERTIKADKDQDQPYPTHVSYVEVTDYNGKPYYMLVCSPIFIRNISQNILFSKIPSIVLTSATLTINNNFTHIMRNLGIIQEKTTTLLLPHVFDFKTQTKLILTPKIPEDPWNKPKERDAYFNAVAKKIEKYVIKTNGNALILCTSNLQLKALHDRSINIFKKAGLNVIRQGGGLTREQLIHEIRTVSSTVLYGVDSFWTGIDVPGANLQNVIIPKLPFPPPTPLSEAQEEVYDIWNKGKPKHKRRVYFSDKTVPEVAIKLKQGFGRLIRHRNDRGIIVLMDPRLVSKPYGKVLLNSLPECDIYTDNE